MGIVEELMQRTGMKQAEALSHCLMTANHAAMYSECLIEEITLTFHNGKLCAVLPGKIHEIDINFSFSDDNKAP